MIGSWAKLLALLAVAALLGGCGGLSVQGALTEARALLGIEPEAPPPPRGIRTLRVAQRRGEPPAYALLVQEAGRRRLWRTEDGRLALSTDGARVVATAGPPVEIAATRIDGADPLEDPFALERRDAVARRVVDLATPDRDPGRMRFGLALECRLSGAVDAAEPELFLVVEACQGPRPVGAFVNRFWLRPERRAPVVRSEQWIGPDLPPLRLGPERGRLYGGRERRTGAPFLESTPPAPEEDGDEAEE